MRKFSQSHHESLQQLNITPLLDLAFVLLVIFIITTTPIVNDLELNLPAASKHEKDPPRKANYVTVDNRGTMFLNKKQVDLPQLQHVDGHRILVDFGRQHASESRACHKSPGRQYIQRGETTDRHARGTQSPRSSKDGRGFWS